MTNICKICTSVPSKSNPGAGLICFKPSSNSIYKYTIISPDKNKLLDNHHSKNISLIQPKYSKSTLFRSKKTQTGKRLTQLKNICWIILKSISLRTRNRFDLLICYSLLNLPAAIFVSLINRCPLVLSFHNISDLHYLDKYKILQCLVQKCDEVWAVSSELEKMLPQYFNKKIFYRPTGFDSDMFYKTVNSEDRSKNVLVTVGSFKWKKDYPTLFKAIRILNERGNTVQLNVIGSGSLEDSLKKDVKLKKVGDNVRFLGTLDQTNIIQHFNRSKLFVMASIAEGRPKVVSEALATGLPCIVTDACNCSDIVEKSGIVVPIKNPFELANAIQSFIENDDLWVTASENSTRAVQPFTWKSIKKLEENRIQKILAAEN